MEHDDRHTGQRDRTADKIGALAKSHDGSEIAETALEEAQARFLHLREIVGAIEDEYDKAVVDVTQISETEAIVDASLTIDELNELFETQIHSEDFDTIGGLIVTELGRLAVPGDEVVVPAPDDLEEDEVAVRLRVMSILGRRIKKVNVQRYEPSAEGSPERAAEAV